MCLLSGGVNYSIYVLWIIVLGFFLLFYIVLMGLRIIVRVCFEIVFIYLKIIVYERIECNLRK